MYVLGDYNAICDACGMKRKASTMQTRWDGFFVCPSCWNVRSPQDDVVGIPDDQTVPIGRPAVTSTVGETTVGTTAERYATTVALTSASGLVDGSPIIIVLDDYSTHSDFCDGTPSGNTVTLNTYLPHKATAGNAVYLPSLNNYTSITATEITGTGL
ncbi:MAG: hypothetical protein GY861_02810 [bacterium]|nr:hypothetical protein [bacterium]